MLLGHYLKRKFTQSNLSSNVIINMHNPYQLNKLHSRLPRIQPLSLFINQINQTNETDQINEIDETNEINEIDEINLELRT